MKIDFHCHTIKSKSEESEERNVSVNLFKEKVLLSGVKIIAITNHNIFDKDQYYEFKAAVKDNCQIWPGIELDVIGQSGANGHLILIANPDDVEEFSKKINKILNGSTPDNFKINLDDLYNEIKMLNLVYVAHCFKSKALPLNDIEEFSKMLENPKRLFKEPSSLTSVTVLQSNKHRVVIGTDVIHWGNYENYNFGEFKFELKDFTSFTKIIEKDKSFLRDIVDEEFSENVKVYGKLATKEHPFIIPIYNDCNIIFGDKGSGKTEILESLAEYYKLEKNEEPVFYKGGDKEEWYKGLIKINSEDYDLKNFKEVDDKKEELKYISNFIDITPVSVKKYKDYFQKKAKKASKDKMKCLSINKRHLYNENKYVEIYNDYKKITSFLRDYNNIDTSDVLENQENELLTSLLKKLKTGLFEKSRTEWINQKSEYLFDDFVTNMSIYVSENVGEPTAPTETGFAAYAKNRLKIRSFSSSILAELEKSNEDEGIYIGNLGAKGDVYLSSNYFFINCKNKNGIDYKILKNNKGDLSNFVTLLEKLKKDFTLDISRTVNDLKVLYDKGINSMTEFIAVKKDFKLNKISYKPSKGENSILALQHELLSKKEKNVFLIDEPDLSLGSTYINEVIVPLFKDLTKSQKILVIATHDANIAVRTRPLNSILKLTENNVYKTFIGNMFTDVLTDIDDENNQLSWKEQSIKYLEGGEPAFEERGELYE